MRSSDIVTLCHWVNVPNVLFLKSQSLRESYPVGNTIQCNVSETWILQKHFIVTTSFLLNLIGHLVNAEFLHCHFYSVYSLSVCLVIMVCMLRETLWSQDVNTNIKFRTKSDMSYYEYGFHFMFNSLCILFCYRYLLIRINSYRSMLCFSMLHAVWTAYKLSVYTVH